MNKKNLVLDTGIFIAFMIAMEPRLSGISIHEWLACALAATIVVHLLLHWKWIIGVGGHFFQKLWHASRLKFVIDLLLFVDFVAVMTSGIMISHIVLPALGLSIGQRNIFWRTLHSLAANTGILLVGLHFALNWDWVVSTVKQTIFEQPVSFNRPEQRVQPIVVRNDENIRKR